jgi:hypothetical protein
VLSSTLAAVHANADLLVGVLLGLAVGLLAGPLLRAWLAIAEWREMSREAELTEALIGRLDRDLDELGDAGTPLDPDEPARLDERTWPTSR